MELMKLFEERFSVRKFSDKKVEKEKVDLTLEAGRLAPTAVDFQPQRIFVLESEKALADLKNCTIFHFDAPLAILVCYDKNESWQRKYDGHNMGEVDASIVATHMMLEVANLGLGTTWVGHFDPQAIINTYKIPENFVPVALFPIGYPANDAEPSPKHFERKPITETVKYL